MLHLTEPAYDPGYFDQARFSRAFAALTGRPPSHFLPPASATLIAIKRSAACKFGCESLADSCRSDFGIRIAFAGIVDRFGQGCHIV